MMRLAVYVRVSTYQQVQTQTIDQQLDRLHEYCQRHGWPWDDTLIFRDDGYSGARLTRPGLDQLRDHVASRGVDRILITAPDRLARKLVHQMLLCEEFERAGCQIDFVDHPMTQDPRSEEHTSE